MHLASRNLFALRLGASLLLLLALAGVGPGWLPGTAIAIVVALSPAVVNALRAAASAGSAGLHRLIERRWFELSLAAILAASVGIRLAGIGEGLWHEPIDVDERRLGDSVLTFFRSGVLSHGTSEDHPGLHFWWLAGVGLWGYLWALMSGLIRGIEGAPVELFVATGRIANVGLAGLTTLLTALVGRAVAGPLVGLLAAVIFSVSPLSLETSTQLRNDVGMACAVVACVYAALVMCERPSRFAPWIVGAIAGVAAGIKITAVFALAPALVAAAWAPGPRRPLQAMAAVLVAFGGALAVSNHFIWSDVPNFLGQIAMDYGHVQPGHFAYTDAPRRGYVSLITSYGVSWPVAVCAGGFAAYALASGERRQWVFLAFPVAYLWFMTLKTALFTRWAYVLIPFVAVAGAAGLLALVTDLMKRTEQRALRTRAAGTSRILGAAVCVAALLPLAWTSSVAISRRFTQPTYAVAETWLAGIASRGDRVLAEQGSLDLSTSGLTVVRVASLSEALERGGDEMRGIKWVVVQEHQFGIPQLSKLTLVKQVVAGIGLGGNRGLDVRIYAPPPSP